MKAILESLKSNLHFYAQHLGIYDYIMLGVLFGGFFLLLLLSLIVLFRSHFFGLFFLLCALAFLCVGGFYGYDFMDNKIRKRELEIVNIKQLQYTPVMLVDLNLTNFSKKNFNFCRVNIEFYKGSKNKIKNMINKFRPFKAYFVDTNEPLLPLQSRDFNITIYDFKPSDYEARAFSECF